MQDMGTGLRAVVATSALLFGCHGGSSSDHDASTGGDGAPPADAVQTDAGPEVDAAPSCGLTWELVDTPISNIGLLESSPVNTDRTARFLVTTEIGGCERLAMPALTLSASTRELYIEMRSFRAVDTDCSDPPQTLDRPVAVQLGAAGSWSVRPGPPGTPGNVLTVEVEPAPDRPCGNDVGSDCGMDCDCAYGEQCLSGSGFGGPFTECARACELDRDCGGQGRCVSIADGLQLACSDAFPECDGSNPCPTGYSCAGGACTPDFLLGSGTRVPCDCDAECEAPLICVEASAPGRTRSCELACPTPSAAWCSIQHYCGPAAEDVAGTAAADSVCVWAGE